MTILLIVCDVHYGDPLEYQGLSQFLHGEFLGSFFKLSDFSYIVDTELLSSEICNKLRTYLKPRDDAYVFTLASRGSLSLDVLLSACNRNDAVRWLQ